MAYGTLTSAWPTVELEKNKVSDLVPMLLLLVFIPFVLWDSSFVAKKLAFLLELGGSENTIISFQIISILTIAVVAIIQFAGFYRVSYSYQSVLTIFLIYLGTYTFLSFLLTGLFIHPIEQYLYLVNIAAILFMLPSVNNTFAVKQEQPKVWLAGFGVVMVILALLAVIAVNSHQELKGSQIRF
jgi:hypothetical protein